MQQQREAEARRLAEEDERQRKLQADLDLAEERAGRQEDTFCNQTKLRQTLSTLLSLSTLLLFESILYTHLLDLDNGCKILSLESGLGGGEGRGHLMRVTTTPGVTMSGASLWTPGGPPGPSPREPGKCWST